MRRILPLALLALAAAPLHAATDPSEVLPKSEPEVSEMALPAPAAAAEAPAAPEMRLEPIQVETRAAHDDALAAQWPQRGSFWWLVGVIVVAGVILALVL